MMVLPASSAIKHPLEHDPETLAIFANASFSATVPSIVTVSMAPWLPVVDIDGASSTLESTGMMGVATDTMIESTMLLQAVCDLGTIGGSNAVQGCEDLRLGNLHE